MVLTLEVTGEQGAQLGSARRKVFTEAGGTVGRSKDNHLSLPDPYVSNHHAVIRFADGQFSIEDTSANGVFLNSTSNRLAKGRPYPLGSNDLIIIEPYEIRAVVEEGARPTPPPRREPVPTPRPGGRAREPRPEPPPSAPIDSYDGGDDTNWEKAFGLDSKLPPAAPVAPRPADVSAKRPESNAFTPPIVHQPAPAPEPSPPGEEFDDYDFVTGKPIRRPQPKPRAARPDPPAASAPAPPVRSAAVPREPVAASNVVDLADVLRGAGLDPSAITPELAQNFGRILRVVVAGVMDVLEARKRIKNEFRLEVTTVQALDNNPLKFSANVEDALHNLLVKRNPAYLGPVQAFEDAFQDIRGHQIAMLAGMRVAFDAMFEHFDPQRLQEAFDRQKKGGMLAPTKSRYWDQYCEMIRDMVRDSESSFRQLFGDEFASAYEEQLKRLKASGRGSDE
jgi:type VI secretion system FHA domain protein